MTRRRLTLGLFSVASLVGFALIRTAPAPLAGGQQSGAACCGPTAPRELDFPYYTLREGFNSTLNLVTDSPSPLDFVIALHSMGGQTLLGPQMTIQPSAKLPIDIRALILSLNADPDGPFGEGSISIYFQGTIMPLVGQLTMTNPANRLVHESEMVENDPGRSDIPPVLNGIWWGLSGGRDARIMVANMSGQAVTADLSLDFAGERHQVAPLAFAGHETKVLSVAGMLAGLNFSASQAPEGGITITQRGPYPSLIAQGRVADPVTGFSTTLEFPDPARQPASALHASGIPIGTPSKDSPFAGIGSFTPHVIARNLLGTAQSVTITVEYPKGLGWNSAEGPSLAAVPPGGSPTGSTPPAQPANPADLSGQLALAPLTVPALSTVDFSLDAALAQLPSPLPFASIRVAYSGPPGSLVAQVSSVDFRQDLVVDGRMMNEGDGWAGSGANPWHLDSNTESILFLTNESDQPARIGFSVTANDIHYYLTKLQLAPHETRAIDLRKLRDAQAPDFKKNNIPAAASDGGVSWIRLDPVPVTGRVITISRNGGIASAYDCCTCQCPANYVGCSVSPGSFDILPGGTQQCTCTATFQNCNGTLSYSNETSSASWSSGNTAVATMDGTTKGLVHGVAGGSTSIKATYSGFKYTIACQPQPCNVGPCAATSCSASSTDTCNVQTPATCRS